METSLAVQEKNNIKELWKRPGGTFAKITGILALGGGIFAFLKYALPFLVAATANLLLFSLELVALAAIIFAVTSKPFRRLVSLTWLQVMRKLYGVVVNIDPIAILQNGINEMKKKLDIVDENVTKLESVLVGMKRKLREYKSNFEKNVRMRDAIQKKMGEIGDPTEQLKYKAQLQLSNNEITRGEQQIKGQTERIIQSEKYLDIMKKLQVAVGFKVQDAENELDYRKDEFEQAKAQQSAMKSITSIMKGCLTSSMEEEIAMEKVTSTVNNSIAEINRLIDGSNDILVNFELNQDINSMKAAEIVKMFESNGFSIFEQNTDEPTIRFSGTPKAISESEAVPVDYSVIEEPEKVPAGRKYF